MRQRIVVLIGGLVAALAALSAVGWGRTTTQTYTGLAGNAEMAFAVSGGKVSQFVFVNRCPGLATGTPVPATMAIRHGRFAYHTQQFTITGRFLSGGRATGTERDLTGDCDSGLLHWRARLSSDTVAATRAQRAGILTAFGAPKAEQPCVAVLIAAANANYGTIRFSAASRCQRWLANGVTVFHRVRANRWKMVFAGSAYRCPVTHLPGAVQRDLGVCPLG